MEPRWLARGRGVARLAAVCLGTIAPGCSTVTPVAEPTLIALNGFSYSGGKATQDFKVPLATMRTAIDEVGQDLRLTNMRETREGVAYLREARTADGRRVVITLRPFPEATRVSVRIFWFGDQALSRYFMDRLGIRLGTRPPAAIEETPPSKPDPNPFITHKGPSDEFLSQQAELRFHDHEAP